MDSIDPEGELARHGKAIADIVIPGYRQNLSRPKIVAQLLHAGYTRRTAMELIDNYEAHRQGRVHLIPPPKEYRPKLIDNYEAHRQVGVEGAEQESHATKDLGCGLLCLLAGGAITAATWAAAGPGGTYIVTSGAFVVGGFYLLRSLFRWLERRHPTPAGNPSPPQGVLDRAAKAVAKARRRTKENQ
jgi:hypothetical protein